MNICEFYGTCENGLSRAEAERRVGLYGANELPRAKSRPLILRMLSGMKDPMLIVLIVASIVSLILAIFDFSPVALFEPCLIFFIVILNALISAVQERRAEKSLEALTGMSARKCKVVRDGEEEIIDSALLVPGDLVALHAGDIIPADCVIIRADHVTSEESMLTGESLAIRKDLGDVLRSGCTILTGSAKAVVEKTGTGTEMGRIAEMLGKHERALTPLQEKLRKLSEQLGIISLVICAVIFAIGLFGIYVVGVRELTSMGLFMTAIALAVSALPEGLPTTVTIVLSSGTRRMAEQKAIVKKLPAVETLGSVSVICTDKTGTLTSGVMTVTEKVSYASDVLTLASICTDNATDPTDSAILSAVGGKVACQKLSVTPFDNAKRTMSVTAKVGGSVMEIVKGAYEEISTLCQDRRAQAKADEMSRRGLRVIAVAMRVIDEPSQIRNGRFEFVGLLGLSDPPRKEVGEAIARCKEAGIRVIMLTGDGVGSAVSVAQTLGLSTECVTGTELALLSDDELRKRLATVGIFARVTPSDKLRVVKALRDMGEVVGVTGDGVNDAPALKVADIGCAMGSGTEVAKAEADIVLTDNNFTTIARAVQAGRGIFENIRKSVAFLLGTNIGEVVAVFLATCISFDSPLLSMQLLWINLISDSFPAIALGNERVRADVMKRKPTPKNEGIFNRNMLAQVIAHGLLFGALALTAFYVVKWQTGDMASARTASFITLALSQTLHAYNMRSDKPLFAIGALSNKMLNLATLFALGLVALVTLCPPLATLFGMCFLPPWAYGLCIGLGVLPLIINEGVKIARYVTQVRKEPLILAHR